METYFGQGKMPYKEHCALLEKHTLFKGLSGEQIFEFLRYADPYYLEIGSGMIERIPMELSRTVCAVFSGYVIIYGVDYSGNRLLHNSISKTESSGTLFSLLDYSNTQVEFEAKRDSMMLFLEPDKLYRANDRLALTQNRILVNLIDSQREMFFELSGHLYCLCQRSIRGKVLKFLNYCVEHYRSYEFDITFSREDLANYLAVDRASLSRTLGELKADGVIDFRKNHFKVLSTKYFQYR